MPLKKPGMVVAAAAAAAADPQAGRPAAIEMLRAASAELRWSGARALAGDAGAVAALDEALAVESDQRVCAAIFTSLSRIDSQESFSVALKYLRTDDARRHGEALEAMKRMPDLALRNLEALLHDADTDVRVLACDLARDLARDLASPHATKLLARLLFGEPDPNVCATAIDVLAEAGTPQDIASLDACAARFPEEPFLGFAVATARRRINARCGGPDA